jgi:hypothetical protein
MTLTIVNDPSGVTGGAIHDMDPALTLQANIERHLTSGADAVLHINGQRVDPLTDPRLDLPPCETDRVCVICRPAGLDPVTWLYIASIALSVYTYASLKKPQAPQVGKDSPNNQLTGQTNVARTYQAIPDVYGYRRVWPDLIQPSAVEYVDNVKRVTEWLCVSRGRGDITDVRFADTPLVDIRGTSVTPFAPALTPSAYPELNSTTLTDLFEVFRSAEVTGQEMGSIAFSEPIEAVGEIDVTGGGLITIKLVDGAQWATLKALAPTGTARVQFVHTYTAEVPGATEYFNAECIVTGYVVTGADVTFTFDGQGSTIIDDSLPQTTAVAIFASSTSSTAIGPYTLPADGNRIRWNTAFLRGLKGTVAIKAEWWKIDSGGVEVSGTRQDQTFTYTADTFDQRFYTEEVIPTGGLGRYRIKLARQTSDLGNGADVATLQDLYAVRYYATKTLPGVTVIKVVSVATVDGSGTPERKFNLRWQRHVRTLSSTSISASRNFARTMAHIWCLAGEDIAGLDTTALGAINTALGETSSLLRFDGSLDDADMSMGERLQLVANHARCTLWRDGQKWTVTRDQARTTPELQLDYRNLAAGADSVINYSAHLPASNDGVELEYVDEATQAKKAYVRLVITSGAPVVGTPSNPLKISLAGCTTTAQAENRAKLEARKLLFQRTSVTDSCLGDGQSLGPGSLVRWIDPNDFAGDDKLQAGEVLTLSGSTITTSELLDFKAQTSGRILFTGVDGLHLGAPVVCTPGAAGAVVLASVPAGLYLANDTTRQLGSRYAFAVGLTDAEVQAAGLYLVADVRPTGDGVYQLSLVNYDVRCYADD